jgi:lipopolysaccharide export system permease protein
VAAASTLCAVMIHSTISRYLIREVARYSALGFLAVTPVILIPNLFERAGEFMVTGITWVDQLEIALWVIPLVAAYVLPISFLFGVMMALGRLSGDLEITALRSCGFGLWRLLAPILILGLGISAITAHLMIDFEPRAQRELVALKLRLAARGSLIEAGQFQSFGPRMLFVRDRIDDRRLQGIMISDRSSKEHAFHVFAETGVFSYDYESGSLRLKLENGDLRMEPNPSKAFEEYRISFSEFDYDFPALKLGAGKLRFRINQLSLDELHNAIQRIESGKGRGDLRYSNPRIYVAQIHRMFAIPVSPMLFAFVGVPLSLLGAIRSRAWGMLLALLLFGGYYSFFDYAQGIGRYGPVPPYIAIWAPNAVLFVVGAFLIRSARQLR